MINARYDKIKGGYLYVIEKQEELINHAKFKELNDAVNLRNAFIDGYLQGQREMMKKIDKLLEDTR